MSKQDPLAVDFKNGWPPVNCEPEILQKISYGYLMVAQYVVNVPTFVQDAVKNSKESEIVLWKDQMILKPDLEQVTQNV